MSDRPIASEAAAGGVLMLRASGCLACARALYTIALAALAGCSNKPATHVVAMSGTRFTPSVDTLQVGDTVVWTNNDLVQHTTTAIDSSFDSGLLEVGQSWRFISRVSGTVAYRCRYHPGMVGTLIVR